MVAALTAAAATFLFAGVIIDHSDALEPADAIYVLGGSRISRALEASELYRSGLATQIIISPGARETAEVELAKRGISVPTEGQVARDILVNQLGIPASAIDVLTGDVDNTAQEASAITSLVSAHRWTKLIVISDCSSTRRAGFVFRRLLGPEVTVISRCARTDGYNPWMWWRSRPSFRETFYEFPKLVAYWCGLRG